MTAPPRIRRDPRDMAARSRQPARLSAVPAEAEAVRIDDPACHVLVVADLAAGRLSVADREAMAAGRQLADLLGGALVLLAGRTPQTELRVKPEAEGADRVMLPMGPAFADELAETRLAFVLGAAEACAARHILFPETAIGGELARRTAARLRDRPAAGLWRLSAAEATVAADAGRLEVQRALPRVLIPQPGAFAPLAGPALREARLLKLDAAAVPLRSRLLRTLPVDPATVPLPEADLILGAGGGVTDWVAFHAAAAALGAAEAGSRVVCDAGALPRDRQVGVSGTVVAPRCYVAIGIAGASQHLHGIADAGLVVAVNADPGADMMQRADLAIVADAQTVLPALARQAAERGRGSDAG